MKQTSALDMQQTSTNPFLRAVRASVERGKNNFQAAEQHKSNNSLRDVILGGQDGLVNMLGIALGVVAAGASTHVLVVTGIAAAITESISMGAKRDNSDDVIFWVFEN
jgi:VIT family